jgi:tripartite motif-containing protein 71
MAEQRQEETAMDSHPRRRSLFVLRLIVGQALLGWPMVSSAAGTWSVISSPGQVFYPTAVAVDKAGNLYVADENGNGSRRIQKRDIQGHWSVIATQLPNADALAVDTAGNLYAAADGIQEQDAQGHWSVIATRGSDLGQVDGPQGLAVDGAGNLYVAESLCSIGFCSGHRIQKRDAQGHWSVIATGGTALGQVDFHYEYDALAVDGADNLYVADVPNSNDFPNSYDFPNSDDRIQKRDAQGNWSVIATAGSALDQVRGPSALAVDTAGNLYVTVYVAEADNRRIKTRDARGNWSVIATAGSAVGQVNLAPNSSLAVDTGGNLYVADTGNLRVLKYTPGP